MNYQLGIYVDLPREWLEEIGKIKGSMKQPTDNTVAPHVSLYICAFKKENFINSYRAIKNINQKSFKISIGKIANDKGFYYLDIDPQRLLNNLHKIILHKVNPLRNGLIRTKDKQRLNAGYYSKKQQQYLHKYGYARVLDSFVPHITLGISKYDLMEKLNKIIRKIKQKSFIIHNISITLFEEEKLEKPIFSSRVKLK